MMTSKITVPRLEDFSVAYEFPSTLDISGYTGTFTVYDAVGGTALLTITEAATANGSAVSVLNQLLVVQIAKEDIATLPVNADPTMNNEFAFSMVIETNTSMYSTLDGGRFIVQPWGATPACNCSCSVTVCIGGQDYTVCTDYGSFALKGDPGGTISVDTIADMTALSRSSALNRQVVVVNDAQRGGNFVWEPLSTTTADNITIFASDSGGAGRYRRLYYGPVRSKWANVDLSGVTSATSVLTTLLTNYNDVYIDDGFYNIPTVLKAFRSDQKVTCGRRAYFQTATLNTMIAVVGTPSADLSNVLASDSPVGTRAHTLAAGKGANFAAGDLVVIRAENAMPSPYNQMQAKCAQYCKVDTVVGDVVTLDDPALFAYTTANTALIQKVTPVKNLTISGLKCLALNTDVARRAMTVFAWCENLVLEDPYGADSVSPFIQLRGCFDTIIKFPTAKNLYSDDVTDFGYMINEQGLNKGTQVIGGIAQRCRHFYTTTFWTATSDLPEVPAYAYGTVTGTNVIGGLAVDMRAAGFDTHESGINVTFTGCKTLGGRATGIQARSVGVKIIGFVGLNLTGEGVYVDSSATDVEIIDATLKNTNSGSFGQPTPVDTTNRGAIFCNGRNTIIRGASIDTCGGPFVEMYDNERNLRISDVRGRNGCMLTTGNKDAIRLAPNATAYCRLEGLDLNQSSGSLDYGVTWNSSVILEGSDNAIIGMNVSDFNGAAHHLKTFGLGRDNIGVPASATAIASGVLTITGNRFNTIAVSGEGGLADTLDTIAGGKLGDRIILQRSGAAITVTHNAGTNGIMLIGNANVTMGSYAELEIINRGDRWVQAGYCS